MKSALVEASHLHCVRCYDVGVDVVPSCPSSTVDDRSDARSSKENG